jgi:hypothetical protein
MTEFIRRGPEAPRRAPFRNYALFGAQSGRSPCHYSDSSTRVSVWHEHPCRSIVAVVLVVRRCLPER